MAFTIERATVHNLSVASAHTFHVGMDGVWVHNCPFEKHHLLPRQFRTQFMKAGIDIEKYVQDIPKDLHDAIHNTKELPGGGSWNASWNSFWDAYPHPRPGHPSVERVEEYLASLKNIYGIP